MRRSQRGFEPSLVPIQSFGAKAMSAKRRNKYEDAADCPGFEFDPVYGFQSLCALCRFPKRLHPSDPSFMFEVTKSPERRRSQAPRWVPYGNGYRRSDRSAPPGARRRNSTSRISGGSSGTARLSRRLSEALSSSGGRRRASSAGEVAKPAMDEGTDSDEDEDTSTGEDDNVERNATHASLRRSRKRLDDKDADANTSEEDENDVRRSRRSSSKKSQRMSFSRRMSSASRRSTASRRSSKARDDDDDKRVSRRSSKARDDDEVDKRVSHRSTSSRRSSKARDDDDDDDDDDDKRVSRRSSKARDDDEDDKRVSHRSTSSRRSSKARDDDEDDQRLSRRSSRRSSGRRSYAREPTIGSFAASTAAAGNARKDSEDENTGGSENDDNDDNNVVAGKRTSTRSSGSKRGSVASRVSQRVSAALQRSAKRLSTISEGSERSEASQKQREQQGDDEDENTTDDDDAAADRTSVHKSASRRSSNVIVGIASAITTGAAAAATRMSKASGRSAVSARSSAKSAAAAADDDDDDEENMSQVSYEEEDYDAFVGKECRAMYHDSETFHPAEVLSHDGDGCFTVRFQKSGTIQRDTEAHDIQIVDDEHDLVAPAEGRVDYDDQIDSLFEACECKDAIALQVLLQKGLNPDERNGMGETPLVVAARAGDVTCAKMLLQFGAADSDGAALAASSSDEMRKLVTEFGFGKTSRDAKLVRYSSGRLDVARKHLSESAATARRDRRPSRYAGSGSGGAAGAGAAGRGASWPLTARDAAAEDEMRSQHSERSRLPSFRGIRRSSSGLAKALCFAQGGKHHGEYEH